MLAMLFSRRNVLFAVNVWEVTSKLKDNSYMGDAQGRSSGGSTKTKTKSSSLSGRRTSAKDVKTLGEASPSAPPTTAPQ